MIPARTLLFLAAALPALTTGLATADAPLALVGATLVDGTGGEPVPEAVVVVSDSRIQCAGSRERCPVPEGARTVELDDRFITPGLVDAHVHYSQTGWADGRPDSLDVRDLYPYAQVVASLEANPGRWHRSQLCSGVTAVFDVGGYPWTWTLRNTARDNLAPHYAAAGPLLSTLDHWVNLPAERQFIYLADDKATRAGIGYLAANETDAVKLWFINAPDRDAGKMEELARLAGRLAEDRGLPFIVHATDLELARIAVEAGAELLVHSVDDKRVDEAFIEAMKDQGTIYTPTLTVSSGYYRMYHAALTGKTPAIDDPNGCVDGDTLVKVRRSVELAGRISRPMGWIEGYRERLDRESRIMAENLKALNEAGVPIATGTDAGNPLTLHGAAIHAEMEAMQAAGLPPMDVIVASTRNGARAMSRADDFGTVQAGRIADLLVLAADPTEDVAHFRKLEYVMRAGQLFEQADLRIQ